MVCVRRVDVLPLFRRVSAPRCACVRRRWRAAVCARLCEHAPTNPRARVHEHDICMHVLYMHVLHARGRRRPCTGVHRGARTRNGPAHPHGWSVGRVGARTTSETAGVGDRRKPRRAPWVVAVDVISAAAGQKGARDLDSGPSGEKLPGADIQGQRGRTRREQKVRAGAVGSRLAPAVCKLLARKAAGCGGIAR